MKRYIFLVAVFLMIAGVAGAQSQKKAAGDKPATAAVNTTSAPSSKDAGVKPAATTPNNTSTDKTTGTVPIQRKMHSKSKSVPASK